MQNIYTLLDSGKTEDREEAYKHILVKQCNELGKIIPEMFEKISDYTELLLPDEFQDQDISKFRSAVDLIENYVLANGSTKRDWMGDDFESEATLDEAVDQKLINDYQLINKIRAFIN